MQRQSHDRDENENENEALHYQQRTFFSFTR